MKVQIEKAKLIKESLQVQLTERMDAYYGYEEEIVSLRVQIDKLMLQINGYQKLGKSSHIIDELIMQTKRDPKDKYGLGYESGECLNSINTNQLKNKYDKRKLKYYHTRGFQIITYNIQYNLNRFYNLYFDQSKLFFGYFFKYHHFDHKVISCK